MSEHDCVGCWRYNPETDREECLVCGAVRAPEVAPDGGQLVSESELDSVEVGPAGCVNCGVAIDITAATRFAHVDEFEAGWLCEACDDELCALCDGRGQVRFPLAGPFDCPEWEDGDPS